jgi:hypothetical protein
MSNINSADLYGDLTQSDLTLKYGTFAPRRIFKVHKMDLCSRSEYFRKLCGSNSQFAESKQPFIELKGDWNIDAVQAWLCWIYTQDYQQAMGVCDDNRPLFDLEVLKVADKYCQTDLCEAVVKASAPTIAQAPNGSLMAVYLKLAENRSDKHQNLVDTVAEELSRRLGVWLTDGMIPDGMVERYVVSDLMSKLAESGDILWRDVGEWKGRGEFSNRTRKRRGTIVPGCEKAYTVPGKYQVTG